MSKNALDYLNEVSEFTEISEYMDDEELTALLVTVAKIIANVDLPPDQVPAVIVKLQAYGVKFSILASWYTNVKKNEREKKNIYYSAKESTDRLVDSLKYMARSHYG